MNRAELVEAATREILSARVRCLPTPPPEETLRNAPLEWFGGVDGARQDATAALNAILAGLSEPSEEMLQASEREWDGRMSFRSTGAWQAMLSTLKDTPNG